MAVDANVVAIVAATTVVTFALVAAMNATAGVAMVTTVAGTKAVALAIVMPLEAGRGCCCCCKYCCDIWFCTIQSY